MAPLQITSLQVLNCIFLSILPGVQSGIGVSDCRIKTHPHKIQKVESYKFTPSETKYEPWKRKVNTFDTTLQCMTVMLQPVACH